MAWCMSASYSYAKVLSSYRDAARSVGEVNESQVLHPEYTANPKVERYC